MAAGRQGGYNAGMRNALKALGAVLAVIALCAPLMFLPVDDTHPDALGHARVTVTVPPTVVVATTIPGLETTTTTTTTTTEPPPQPVITSSTTTTMSTTTTTGPIDITIAAVGDLFTSPAILDSVHDSQSNSYDFGPVFAPIAPYLSKADYTVADLEPRLAGPTVGYSSETAPNAPRELAFALKAAGVDLVGTANQHSLDLGWDGLVGTLDRLDAAGLAHTGTNRTKAERNTPVIADVKGIRVAFLDYTTSVAGSLPADQQKDFAVNKLDLDTVTQDATTARSWGADVVVAMVDYGSGSEEQTAAEQKTLSDAISNHGVEVILGCRAGTIQTISHFFPLVWPGNDKYIAYSLGDFLSVPKSETTTTVSVQQTGTTVTESVPQCGLAVYLHFEKRGLRTYATGVSYLPLYVQVGKSSGSATEDKATTTTTSRTTSTTQGATGKQGSPLYRILPVLPGLEPATDVPLTDEDRQRMSAIYEYARNQLYRPDENITPLAAGDLGL
jgi:hypothetical protein